MSVDAVESPSDKDPGSTMESLSASETISMIASLSPTAQTTSLSTHVPSLPESEPSPSASSSSTQLVGTKNFSSSSELVNITITETEITSESFSAYLLSFLAQISFLPFRLVSYTITVTFSSWTLFSIMMTCVTCGYLVFRYRILTRYSRLPAPPKVSTGGAPFDLRPDEAADDSRDGPQSYQDELMGAFLSSIKVFGYLDRPVFHELARHLQTKKLKQGDILFDHTSDTHDFFVVVDGTVQVYLKTTRNEGAKKQQQQEEEEGLQDDDEEDDQEEPGFKTWKDHILLNEVRSGGTVSSLFSILSVFCQDLSIKTASKTTAASPEIENVFPGLRSSLSSHIQVHASSSAEPIVTQQPHEPLEKQQDSCVDVHSLLPKDPSETLLENKVQEIVDPIDGAVNESQQIVEPIPIKPEHPSILDTNTSPFNIPTLSDTVPPTHPKQIKVHPDIVARASEDTTLAVIPAAAFQKLADKFPSAAAGIILVILIRFQRVTFNTLYRYLGLSKELLRIEKQVNDFMGQGLPGDFFDGDWEEGLSNLKRKLGLHPLDGPLVAQAMHPYHHLHPQGVASATSQLPPYRLARHTDTEDQVRRFTRPHGFPSSLKPPLTTPKLRKVSINKKNVEAVPGEHIERINEDYEGDFEDSEMESDASLRHSRPPLVGLRSETSRVVFDDYNEDDVKLKQCCYDLIVQLIGFNPDSLNGAHASTPPSPSTFSLSTISPEKSLFDESMRMKNRRLSHHRRASIDSTTEDEQGSSLPASASSSTNSLFSEPWTCLNIMSFTADQVLFKEGDRVEGLYFVINGLLEASIKARTEDMSAGGGFAAPGKAFYDNVNNAKEKRESDERAFKKSLFLIREGGLAGYLSVLTGHPSFVTLRAKTDTIVAFLPKSVLDRYVERCPLMLLKLAKNLISNLSPIVFHIDIALEWGHVNAGQILCRQNEKADSIYLVLSGRLRTILEGNITVASEPPKKKEINKRRDSMAAMDHARLDAIGGNIFPEGPTIASSHFEILGEHGQGESVGELEVLTGGRRPGTVHAIRDSEVTIMPKTLFEAIAYQHPTMTIQISRIIAAKTFARSSRRTTSLDSAGYKVGQIASPYSTSVIDSAANNINLKTVAILPINSLVPIAEFTDRLKDALVLLGASLQVLNTSTVMSRLGKHAFSRFGRLKLMSWLSEVEDRHRLVLYVADGGVNSPWTQRCVRQADCILLVGLGDEDPAIGEYERLLIGMKTTARKELVLLHSERYCVPGSTAQWLKNRVQMTLKTQNVYANQQRKIPTITHLKSHIFGRYYTQNVSRHMKKTGSLNTHTGLRSDFARLGRRLLSKSVGLALGGGGARGISQVGIIRAFEEAGIPVDMVGGTSIGAFVGGLYARENDHVSIFGRAKSFSNRMGSLWRKILDITYPVTSLFTGHEFNRGIWKVFLDTHIEDCWQWRYIRASMSLSGYLPPLCDNGHMLLDGGYLNNLPADVMKVLGADTVIAIDVGSTDDTTPMNYGDSLSGWWVLLNRLNPLAGILGPDVSKIPQLAEIQSRLAYVSSVKQLEDAQRVEGVIYLKPPVNSYGTLEFGRYLEVYQTGYTYGKQVVAKWEKDGTLQKLGVSLQSAEQRKNRTGRRASI